VRVALLTTVVLLLVSPAAASAASAPAATTGPATDVERTSATLTGTVDPNSAATTYHFEYGTTTAYGLRTADQPAGSGDAATSVEAAVTGLTSDTTYHYRIVASNSHGPAMGADQTLHTRPDPRPPAATTTPASQIMPSDALLRGSVDPNDGDTKYYFEWGRTTSYGTLTELRDAGDGNTAVEVSETIAGLRPYTRYHFRLVATNSAGTTRGRDRSFLSQRLPTAVTLTLVSGTPRWGGGVELRGRVTGDGVSRIPVGLQRQDFPFSTPASSLGTPFPVRADRSGRFSFFLSPLFVTTRLRAVTRTKVVVFSEGVEARVTMRVGIGVRQLAHGRVRLRGVARPAAPNGRAILERRSAGGRWVFVRRAPLKKLTGDRSRYTFIVRRLRKARTFRVKVVARDGGAHYPGRSRAVLVPRG
jgi:hypothetical protein